MLMLCVKHDLRGCDGEARGLSGSSTSERERIESDKSVGEHVSSQTRGAKVVSKLIKGE